MELFCAFLAVACIWDYRYRRFPNRLLLVIGVYGIAYTLWMRGLSGMAFFLVQMLLVLLILFPFFSIGCLGGGDVKLLCIVAGVLEAESLPMFFLVTLGMAAGLSLIKMLYCGILRRRFWLFIKYIGDCVKGRRLCPYPEVEGEEERLAHIAMGGPIFFSMLIHCLGFF